MCYRWMERPSKPKYGIQPDRSDTEQLPQRKFVTEVLNFSHRAYCVCVYRILCVCVYARAHTHHIYIYIYIYVCVWVCVCVGCIPLPLSDCITYIQLTDILTEFFETCCTTLVFFSTKFCIFHNVFWFIKYILHKCVLKFKCPSLSPKG